MGGETGKIAGLSHSIVYLDYSSLSKHLDIAVVLVASMIIRSTKPHLKVWEISMILASGCRSLAALELHWGLHLNARYSTCLVSGDMS